ncbi:hypothetical protein H2199_002577 [Coniosporium tulheliwenetii]|uniref:Uncharacterized protein n=1 Tax=Coniosporium tulheliwenetii TaxID=3383036 RepID=A0ACC2ZGT5_9PEZI|nr:hypothetical protein H2199_002577 [Cladosporium sp. JES 115]
MESIIHEDSPLAAYLEGEGHGAPEWTETHEASETHSPERQSFAPSGTSALSMRIRDKLPQPIRIHLTDQSTLGRIHTACSRAINSRLGRADNVRFLEHFRYIIVASQLLSEHPGQTSFKPPPNPHTGSVATAPATGFSNASTNVTGAVVTAVAAFALVWLLHWARGGRPSGFSKGRLSLVLAVFVAVATVAYSYVRRQWLQYVRQQAVNIASTLIANLHAFDASTSTALTLIQEVELVSRGYRLSTPLPPITRLDEKGQSRRCSRLRRNIRSAFAAAVPLLSEECGNVRRLSAEDDLERYLEVYDITNPDLHEASLGYSDSEFEDPESLKTLRILQYRFSTLRRVFLCSLLSLEADGGSPDFARWSSAVESMLKISALSAEWSEKINSVLNEEEQITMPPTPKAPVTPGRQRLRAQVRKLSALSQGIKGLQAKMQILREESARSLEESEDISDLGASLMAQYESIGADLKSLMQAWESGKASLALNIDRRERRVSQASSGLRSPVPSLGGLTVVDEGSPSDALRALNGELPEHSGPSSTSGSASDEEIFEAIAIPRQRNRLSMSREERMAKMHEDQARQASFREQREANTNMLKELESVINLRPNRQAMGRVTSI